MRLFGQSSEYDVSISEYNFAKTHHINIPNFSHVPLARFGWGGLGVWWHRVSDCSQLTRIKYAEELKHGIVGRFGITSALLQASADLPHCEFIPFWPRSVNNLTTRLPESIKTMLPVFALERSADKWRVTFIDGTNQLYDVVWLCAGIAGNTSILVESSLAERSPFLSDHLVISVNEKIINRGQMGRVFRSARGFAREYFLEDDIKVSFRPHGGMDKQSLIYSKNPLEVAKGLIMKPSISSVLDAFYLRYSVDFGSRFLRRFLQVSAKNIYEVSDQKIRINDAAMQFYMTKCANYLGHDNFSVDSGIHYWGSVDLKYPIETLKKQKLYIAGGAHWTSAPPNHFTFINALEIIRDFYSMQSA